MKLLVAFKHGNELHDLPSAGFGLLHVLDAEENRVAIGSVQSLEEFVGALTRRKGDGQIFWNSGPAGRVVRGIPAAVDFGAIYGFETSGLHVSAFGESEGFLAVDLGPDAFLGARHEAL